MSAKDESLEQVVQNREWVNEPLFETFGTTEAQVDEYWEAVWSKCTVYDFVEREKMVAKPRCPNQKRGTFLNAASVDDGRLPPLRLP